MAMIGFLGAFFFLNIWLMARRDSARGRKLRSTKLLADDRFVYLSLPGLALLLFGFGFMGMAVPVASTTTGMWFSVAAAICTVFGLLLSLWGVFGKTVPLFAQPRWTRATQKPPSQSRKKGPGKGPKKQGKQGRKS